MYFHCMVLSCILEFRVISVIVEEISGKESGSVFPEVIFELFRGVYNLY